MPILKVDILDFKIEINYQENEKNKLLYLIENFKNRLNEFSAYSGRINNNKIIFLSALKAEDDFEEAKKSLKEFHKKENKIIEQQNIIEKLTKEIISLKDLLDNRNSINQSNEENYLIILEQIIQLENILKSTQQKILIKNNDKH